MKPPLRSLFLVFLSLPLFLCAQDHFARKGLMDFRSVDFAKESPASLNGEWEFYMADLVDPDQFTLEAPPKEYTEFPSTWNDLNKSTRPGNGYATYRLKVLVSHSDLALEIPHFYSNYVMWINGREVASNGQVGKSPTTSIPQWMPQTIEIPSQSDTLEIVIQVSNFDHAKGGVREPIRLGSSEDLTQKRKIAIGSYLAMVVFLLLICIVSLVVYSFGKPNRAILYLAALCFTWCLRAMFSNLYIANNFIPEIPWELCVKIEYLTLYLMMIWAILFLAALFKSEVNTLFKYMFCICNGMFVIITLFFSASIYTQFLPVYLSFAAVLLIYIVFVLIRAIVYEREGVWLIVGSIFLAVMLFSYDIISYEGFAAFNPIVINTGYVTIFVLMSLSLLYKLGYLKKTSGGSMLRYEDLYGPGGK